MWTGCTWGSIRHTRLWRHAVVASLRPSRYSPCMTIKPPKTPLTPREARLAEALRQNLRRRKAAGRASSAPSENASEPEQGAPDTDS